MGGHGRDVAQHQLADLVAPQRASSRLQAERHRAGDVRGGHARPRLAREQARAGRQARGCRARRQHVLAGRDQVGLGAAIARGAGAAEPRQVPPRRVGVIGPDRERQPTVGQRARRVPVVGVRRQKARLAAPAAVVPFEPGVIHPIHNRVPVERDVPHPAGCAGIEKDVHVIVGVVGVCGAVIDAAHHAAPFDDLGLLAQLDPGRARPGR